MRRVMASGMIVALAAILGSSRALLSGDNAVAVIDYGTAKEVARVPVGKFPQRNRAGLMAESALRVITAPKP